MSTTMPVMFSIEQLQMLRSARALVKQEFGFSLSVSAGNVLEQLYAFALSSTDEALLKLHRDIMAIGERTMAEAATRPSKSRTTAYRGSNSASEPEAKSAKRPQMYRGSVVGDSASAESSATKASYYRGARV